LIWLNAIPSDTRERELTAPCGTVGIHTHQWLDGTAMKILVALSTIAIACAFNTAPAAAQNAFCLRGCDSGYSNCGFSTLQQCQASASGLTAWCEANPYFRQASEVPQPAHARYSKRRL